MEKLGILAHEGMELVEQVLPAHNTEAQLLLEAIATVLAHKTDLFGIDGCGQMGYSLSEKTLVSTCY